MKIKIKFNKIDWETKKEIEEERADIDLDIVAGKLIFQVGSRKMEMFLHELESVEVVDTVENIVAVRDNIMKINDEYIKNLPPKEKEKIKLNIEKWKNMNQ